MLLATGGGSKVRAFRGMGRGLAKDSDGQIKPHEALRLFL